MRGTRCTAKSRTVETDHRCVLSNLGQRGWHQLDVAHPDEWVRERTDFSRHSWEHHCDNPGKGFVIGSATLTSLAAHEKCIVFATRAILNEMLTPTVQVIPNPLIARILLEIDMCRFVVRFFHLTCHLGE